MFYIILAVWLWQHIKQSKGVVFQKVSRKRACETEEVMERKAR